MKLINNKIGLHYLITEHLIKPYKATLEEYTVQDGNYANDQNCD